MRALILLAHPEPRSFNAHLATQAAEQLRHDHLQVDVVDLYAEGFDPLEAAHHHSSRLQPDRFDAQLEQRYGAEQGRLPADVQRHLQLLQAADLVILQFPLWWFAAPAILKGWLDRVLVYGPMYNSRRRHEHGAMRGKRALPSVTTGSSARACGMDGREGDTRLLLWPLMYSLRYVGFDVMEPHVVHGVRSGLAPERVPLETIRALVERGVIVAAGHTAGTYEEIREGLDAGVRGFTHLYNAMSPLQGREPGAVGAALEDRDSWIGIIVDGVHVHPASLRVALAAKPRGRLLLVTDAMPPVGADDPSYVLYGETITAIDGVVRNAAGSLAGSALDMATAVRNTVQLLGQPLAEAARMASTYPAQFLNVDDRLGHIAEGYQADLVLLDDALQVRGTWIAGQYEAA